MNDLAKIFATVSSGSSMILSRSCKYPWQESTGSFLGFLEGHCHAMWQLCEKLEGVFASTELKK